jgi:uncharacterized membrane protein (DUF106 family)
MDAITIILVCISILIPLGMFLSNQEYMKELAREMKEELNSKTNEAAERANKQCLMRSQGNQKLLFLGGNNRATRRYKARHNKN